VSRAVQAYFETRYPRRASWIGALACRRGEELRLAQLRRWVPTCAGLSILDAGCGDGEFLWRFLRQRPRRLRIEDFAASQLALARARLCERADEFTACSADIRCSGDQQSYDLVLALGVFDYTPDWPALLRSLLRRTHGVLCADVPKAGTLHGCLRRVWLRTQGIGLQSASRRTLAAVLDPIRGTVDVVDLPLHWMLRIEPTRGGH
jgi:trans-aconitate methyltransferase